MIIDHFAPHTLLAAEPAFAAHARPATLLRPSAGDPGPCDSSVGGPLLWPADEPWPVCRAAHRVERRELLSDREREVYQEMDRRMHARRLASGRGAYMFTAEEAETQARIMDGARALDMITWERIRADAVQPAVPVPMLPVLQLHARDAPDLPRPAGTDLLQMLRCPDDHPDLPGQPHYGGPNVAIRYRAAADVDELLTPPRPESVQDRYRPRPCTLNPVHVVDLPNEDELPADLPETAETWAEERGIEYARTLACLPGWKAGGWPSWHSTDLVPIDCVCGARLRLLLTLDSGSDPGLNVGRFAELRVFACPEDLSHPVRMDIQ